MLAIFRITRWWFQRFFIFTPTCRDDPIWLMFFEWVETTNQIDLAGLLKTLWNSSNHWNMVTKSRIHLIASLNLGFIRYLKMGPGIIEEFILNWLCPFSVCNEQDHIPWQCQPVQIRRKSSFLFCLNQSPKFQSNSNRVWAWGKWKKMIPLQLQKRWKHDLVVQKICLLFHVKCKDAQPHSFSCLKISDHWKPIYCNSLIGHDAHTHTHILIKWKKPSNSIGVSRGRGTWCFRYMFAKMKCLFHMSLKRLIFVAQEMGKFRKCLSTFQIMEEWTMNYYFFCLKAVDQCNLLQIIDEEFK